MRGALSKGQEEKSDFGSSNYLGQGPDGFFWTIGTHSAEGLLARPTETETSKKLEPKTGSAPLLCHSLLQVQNSLLIPVKGFRTSGWHKDSDNRKIRRTWV